MRTDTKIIVGLTALGFGLLHLLLLGYVFMVLDGESQNWAVWLLELPVGWTWPGGEALTTDFWFRAYFALVGSLFYALVIGVPVGLAICGVRNSLKRKHEAHDA